MIGAVGRTILDRLTFIIKQAPTVAHQAVRIAQSYIREVRDPQAFTSLYFAYEQAVTAAATLGEVLPPWTELAKLDQSFVDELNRRNVEERTKLELRQSALA